MEKNLKVVRLKGKEIIPYIPDLARLRIKIFRDYPYLYEGKLAYEEKYLTVYSSCAESIVVLVFDQDKVVGASTAIPLEFETDEFKKPFIDQNMKVEEVFYLGESVLSHEYRGKNIYRHFFHERESAAREYGCSIAAFCAIERPTHHPLRPEDYVPLDDVWKHFGYKKHQELCAQFEWKEVGEDNMSFKPLIFWLKNL